MLLQVMGFLAVHQAGVRCCPRFRTNLLLAGLGDDPVTERGRPRASHANPA